MISLDIFGDPTPQMRPKFSRVNNFVRTYDPQAKLKETLKWQVKSQYREEPLSGPLTLDITYFMPIPKSTSGIRKRQMINGTIYHIKRPDIDNLLKLSFDVLNEVIFLDDSQIVEIRARKVYSSKPGTFIRIYEMSQINQESLGNENSERISR